VITLGELWEEELFRSSAPYHIGSSPGSSDSEQSSGNHLNNLRMTMSRNLSEQSDEQKIMKAIPILVRVNLVLEYIYYSTYFILIYMVYIYYIVMENTPTPQASKQNKNIRATRMFFVQRRLEKEGKR